VLVHAGVRYGQVRSRADRVLIVACGPSVAGVDLGLIRDAAKAGVYVLAVKGAIEWLPVANGFVTVDPNDRAREMVRRKRRGCEYFFAVPEGYGT